MAQCKKFNESHAVQYYFIENWEEFEKCIKFLPNAVYRGQSDATWSLTTNFERRFHPLRSTDKRNLEERMISECARKYSIYDAQFTPPFHNPITWLSLIQHYGGSTRLLDVSRSPYVALFFALADMKKDSDACLWAIKAYTGINDMFLRRLTESVKDSEKSDEIKMFWQKTMLSIHRVKEKCLMIADEILRPDDYYTVDNKSSKSKALADAIDYKQLKIYQKGSVIQIPVECESRRSVAQQAEFLFPINIEKSFEENLIGLLDLTFPCKELDQIPSMVIGNRLVDFGMKIMKLIIPYSLRFAFLKKLDSMNINYESLYPDVEGLMRNLALENEGE